MITQKNGRTIKKKSSRMLPEASGLRNGFSLNRILLNLIAEYPHWMD
jgi:hypothetical protein